MNPHNVNVELPESKPTEKITSYTQALSDLGLMTRIYQTGELKIQSQDIADNTGSSATTGGEIQRNITEIMKSTLNSIGGEVTFIEYDPSFIQNQMVTGYSNFENKTIPAVVITGGITEFDRGLETFSEGTNFDLEAKASGLPSWVPSDTSGTGIGDTGKTGKARITLDFNLKNFQTLAGIPKMTTTNSMEVYKGLHEKELGITLFGPTFGMKGSMKKVQGRHEAVRLLVQVSMIQMVGKYLDLPYWKLLGEDAQPDQVVLDSIKTRFYNMAPMVRMLTIQQYLVLHGYDVKLNGQLDSETISALKKFNPSFSGSEDGITEKLFTNLYLNIPTGHSMLARRNHLNEMLAQLYAELNSEPEPQPVVEAQPVAAEQPVAETQPAATSEPQQQPVNNAPSSTRVSSRAPTPAPVKNKGFGRKLSDDEW